MDFQNYDDDDYTSYANKGIKAGARGIGKAGKFGIRTAGKLGKRAAKRVRKRTKKGAAAAGKILGKLVSLKVVVITIVAAMIIFLVIMMVYMGSFFTYGETDGERGNYVEANNTKNESKKGVSGGGSSDSGNKTYNTETNADGSLTLSTSNSACLAYYTLLSREKSAWQEVTDENGETVLIQNSDDMAVKDALGNDENYYINPNLLYAMNKYLYDNDYVYPEAFLKPVAYEKKDGSYSLLSLTDDDGNVTVTSDIYREDGKKAKGTEKSVSDYGLGTVFVYKQQNKNTVLKGTYVKEDYYDSVSGTVKQRTVNEPFEISIKTQSENIIDTAITFCGVVSFEYADDVSLDKGVSEGESTSESDNVTKILYKTERITLYTAKKKNTTKTFTSKKEIDNFVKKNKGYKIVKKSDGTYKTTTKSYNLYKYRSADSGIYVKFVKLQSADIKDENNTYLYDYLQNFSTYKPVITRSYDTFKDFSGGGSVGEFSTAVIKGSVGSGSNTFEKLYNGSKKEVIEEIWDGLINYGFSEEQAAAIIGNMCLESGFDATVTNGIGAYGLCQWLGTRKKQLFVFAKNYNGENTPSVRSEIQFTAIEALGGGKWATNQWSGSEAAQKTFFSSGDIETLAKAWDTGFERSGGAGVSARQKYAKSAYALLSGREVKEDKDIIVEENSAAGSSTAVKSLSEEDQTEFNEFYHSVDNIYDGSYMINSYYNPLTREKAELVIKTANSYINGTSLTQESLTIENQMWSKNYISDLTKSQIDNDSDEVKIFVSTDSEYLVPVVGYTVTSEYGRRSSPTAGASSNHMGIDLACAYGIPVMAAKDGTVVFAGYGGSGGYYVIIDHGTDDNGNNIRTMYLHNSRLVVKAGDKVKQGQKIAEAGSTGISTGTHCHLSVFENGIYVNPRKYFNIN